VTQFAIVFARLWPGTSQTAGICASGRRIQGSAEPIAKRRRRADPVLGFVRVLCPAYPLATCLGDPTANRLATALYSSSVIPGSPPAMKSRCRVAYSCQHWYATATLSPSAPATAYGRRLPAQPGAAAPPRPPGWTWPRSSPRGSSRSKRPARARRPSARTPTR
jgi:hypothetical protein